MFYENWKIDYCKTKQGWIGQMPIMNTPMRMNTPSLLLPALLPDDINASSLFSYLTNGKKNLYLSTDNL